MKFPSLPAQAPKIQAPKMPALGSLNALAIGSIATNALATFVLFVLFCWSAASSIFDAEAKDDGNNKWWDLDLTKVERSALKVVLNLLVLLVASCFLLVLMVKTFNKMYDRFNLGVLAASTFMIANMLFVSFWFSLNFGGEEKEENNDGDGWDEMDMLNHERTVVAVLSILFALAFSAISVLIYHEGKRLPEAHSNNTELTERAGAHLEILGELWTLLSACTITLFVALLIAACAQTAVADDKKMWEGGVGGNLIGVLVWLVLVSAFVLVIGRKIFGETKMDGTLGVGMLSGGVLYYALLLFMVYILYSNPTFKERAKDDGAGAATALGFAGFFLSFLHLAFFAGLYKYKASLFAALPGTEMEAHADASAAGDFQRMAEEPETEMASGSYAAPQDATEEPGGAGVLVSNSGEDSEVV